jgi:integrase
MARTVADSNLGSRAARDRLAVRFKPYWKTLEPGALHLGYRRKRKDQPGLWLARRYKGARRYQIVPLALADDFTEGTPGVMSYADAQRAAHSVVWATAPARRRSGTYTVTDALRDYTGWLRAHRATAADAEGRARRLILPALGSVPVAELTSTAITDWLNAMAGSGALTRGKTRPCPATDDGRRARRASANRVLTSLKAALNKAFRDGLVDDDTAWRRVRAFAAVDAARPGFLSIDECQRLIAAAEGGFRNLVHAALLTGCRYGELCALECRDYAHGKLNIKQSKTGKPRWVVLTPEGQQFFRTLTAGRPGSDRILIRDDGRYWTKSDQAYPMREACARAGISPAIGIHQLRHTYASLCVAADMPLMVLARNLGHASTRMVERHYGHLREDYVDRAIAEGAPRFAMNNLRKLG